eukprot:GHVT01053011.1.p1 GENE.GHVT01053011.1~~GHVT01053011.1.p1  ORF type:complete len:420 (+),score=28.09 GHVT01053011.1:74-1333(+)
MDLVLFGLLDLFGRSPHSMPPAKPISTSRWVFSGNSRPLTFPSNGSSCRKHNARHFGRFLCGVAMCLWPTVVSDLILLALAPTPWPVLAPLKPANYSKEEKFRLNHLLDVYNKHSNTKKSRENAPKLTLDSTNRFVLGGKKPGGYFRPSHALRLLSNPCLQSLSEKQKEMTMNAAFELEKLPGYELGMNYSLTGGVEYFVYIENETQEDDKPSQVFALPTALLEHCALENAYDELIKYIGDLQDQQNQQASHCAANTEPKTLIWENTTVVYNWNYSVIIGTVAKSWSKSYAKRKVDQMIKENTPQCRAFAKLEIILKEKFGPFGTFKRRKGGGMKVADRRWTNRHMKVSPSMTLTSRQVKRLNPPMFFGVCENKGNWKIPAQNVPEPVKDLLKLSSKICHNDVLVGMALLIRCGVEGAK